MKYQLGVESFTCCQNGCKRDGENHPEFLFTDNGDSLLSNTNQISLKKQKIFLLMTNQLCKCEIYGGTCCKICANRRQEKQRVQQQTKIAAASKDGVKCFGCQALSKDGVSHQISGNWVLVYSGCVVKKRSIDL